MVTGLATILDAEGHRFLTEETIALCRYGASVKKPFCDGTHSKIGFRAVELAEG